MEERLVIIKDGEEKELDIKQPSGITLTYQNNLFTDLSKITCNHSYTFSIPKTVNNQNILELPEDMRHNGSVIRVKNKCRFCIGGVPIVDDGRFYITGYKSDGYQCVMTWNICEGLQNINDNDVSIKDLRSLLPNMANADESQLAYWGTKEQINATDFDNTAAVLYPIYNCGVPYTTWNRSQSFNETPLDVCMYNGGYAYPKPVVPVKYILGLIEEAYGISIKLGSTIKGNSEIRYADNDDRITYGVIPLCGTALTDEQVEASMVGVYFGSYNNRSFFTDSIFGVDYAIPLGSYRLIGSLASFKPVYIQAGTDNPTSQKAFDKIVRYKPEDGYHFAGFNAKSIEIDGSISVCYKSIGEISDVKTGEAPKLILKGLRYDGNYNSDIEDLITVEPTYTKVIESPTYGSNLYFVYNFRSSDGYDRIRFDEDCTYCCFFALSQEPTRMISSELFLRPNQESDVMARTIDTVSNLPDISCLTFVKSLFYMIGAYPRVDYRGAIVPVYYTDILDYISDGDYYDWSDKMRAVNAEELNFSISNFKRNNYYMMKSDKLDKTESEAEKETDVYEDGIGDIKVTDETLDKRTTVFQCPFNAPYILNRNQPHLTTGNTIKAWTYEADNANLQMVENKAAYGLVYMHSTQLAKKEYDTDSYGNLVENIEYVDSTPVFSMEVYSPFKLFNDSYKFLQKIVEKPFVIKQKFNLTCKELNDIMLWKPVYLEKYNSFFAIVKIDRASDGTCTAELIKIPN